METYALEASFYVNEILRANPFFRAFPKHLWLEIVLESYVTLKARRTIKRVGLGPTGAKWDKFEALFSENKILWGKTVFLSIIQASLC